MEKSYIYKMADGQVVELSDEDLEDDLEELSDEDLEDDDVVELSPDELEDDVKPSLRPPPSVLGYGDVSKSVDIPPREQIKQTISMKPGKGETGTRYLSKTKK